MLVHNCIAIQPEELGVTGVTLKQYKVVGELVDNVFVVDFEVIEIDVAAGERIKNPFAILQNLKRIAREHGAHTLRIETTFANEELEAIAQRVFRGRIHAGSPGGRVDIIEIPL